MAIRLTPHLLSVIDWKNPLDDPIRRQFLPLASGIVPDHQKLTLDSLNEQDDSRTCSLCLFNNQELTPDSCTWLSSSLSWKGFVSRCVSPKSYYSLLSAPIWFPNVTLTATATSICPVYCRFCTRSYAVGANTETVSKSPQKPSRRRWEVVFQHIENDPSLHDIVVSGGDAYYLQPEDLREIGERFVGLNMAAIII